MFLDIYLESIQIEYFYHGSSIQNLKELIPRPTKTFHSEDYKDKKLFYVSSDKSLASMFTFPWKDSDGISSGRYNSGPWTIKIPKRLKYLLEKPCSIYFLSPNNNFIKIREPLNPEYISYKPCKILKEEKYESALQCMKENGVKIKFLNQDQNS